MRELFSLEGKTTIITGAAGYLGSEITLGLLEFGSKVAAVDILDIFHNSPYKEWIDKGCLEYLEYNLSDSTSIKEMFKNIIIKFGKIDVLINCAHYGAGYGHLSSVEIMSDEVWFKGLDGTAGITFRCTREAIPYMANNGSGSVINFSSMYGIVSPDPSIYNDSGQNNPANYGAGKAAVLQFTRHCAAHFANNNIRFNSITPGPFPAEKTCENIGFIKNLNKKTMLGRVGKPREVVGATIFLASDASSYMTGSNITIDGGWTAW